MKSVNLLLAGADRRVNNLVEATVRDACYGQTFVECRGCCRLDEFVRQGSTAWLDLIVVAPGSLLPASNRRGAQVPLAQVAEAIRSIQHCRPLPVLAINVVPEDRLTLLEAGVDTTFGFPLEADILKREVRRILRLPEPQEKQEVSGGSLGALLLRGWQRLKNA